MGYFLSREELIDKIYEILDQTNKELFIVSPFFKLSDNIKLKLEKHRNIKGFKLRILFGKNENDKTKSLSLGDFKFFQQFEDVEIRYNESLHAKYFASEKAGVVTSLNFHDFSIKNNLEVGTVYNYNWRDDLLVKVFRNSFFSEDAFLNTKARRFFDKEFDHSDPIYIKKNGRVVFEKPLKEKVHKSKINSNSDIFKMSSDKKHVNAGAPWSKDLNKEFERLVLEGKSIEELMSYFGRSKNAIEIKIKKLKNKIE